MIWTIFKKYNDRNGHLQGDRLLTFFGKLLQKAVEGTNFTVARYGGEEFAILMPNTTKEDAYAFLNRLRKEVNDTYFEGVEHIPYRCLSFSCGIAEMEKRYVRKRGIDPSGRSSVVLREGAREK
ncbi:hypothetical protein DI43_08730 [Geobacillus sp. CAMR12739]|nr:hypothetical protein DI43_08730 [Geobacillus sp. CAMR12739]